MIFRADPGAQGGGRAAAAGTDTDATRVPPPGEDGR